MKQFRTRNKKETHILVIIEGKQKTRIDISHKIRVLLRQIRRHMDLSYSIITVDCQKPDREGHNL